MAFCPDQIIQKTHLESIYALFHVSHLFYILGGIICYRGIIPLVIIRKNSLFQTTFLNNVVIYRKIVFFQKKIHGNTWLHAKMIFFHKSFQTLKLSHAEMVFSQKLFQTNTLAHACFFSKTFSSNTTLSTRKHMFFENIFHLISIVAQNPFLCLFSEA